MRHLILIAVLMMSSKSWAQDIGAYWQYACEDGSRLEHSSDGKKARCRTSFEYRQGTCERPHRLRRAQTRSANYACMGTSMQSRGDAGNYSITLPFKCRTGFEPRPQAPKAGLTCRKPLKKELLEAPRVEKMKIVS